MTSLAKSGMAMGDLGAAEGERASQAGGRNGHGPGLENT